MKRYIILALIGLSTVSSCKKDFLDTRMQTSFDEELFLNSGFNNLKALGMGVYNYLPQFNGYGNNALLAAASDEADFARANSIQKFNTGSWGPFSNPDDVFGDYYKGIRHANLFLEKTVNFRPLIAQDTVTLPGLENYRRNIDDMNKLRAEVRFLRAFYHMELAKRYGRIPIVTKVLTEAEAREVTQSSFQEAVDFIVAECNAAYTDLTNHYVGYTNAFPTDQTVGRGDGGAENGRLGRIEKPAAVALKLRALLYAASPLHNPTNDVTKWQRATEAGIQFLTDPNCAHVRFLYNNYRDLFTSQSTVNTLTPRKGANTGIIMTRPFSLTSDAFEKANYPIGMTNGGAGVTAPSQNLVDAYEMRTTGKPITDPTSGYDPNNPYANRDPRLALTVVVNGSNMGLNTNNSARVVQSFDGGADGIGAKAGATTTGYYLRKMVIENYNITQTNQRAKAWVLMRYAEVLLNFAEAANEAYGADVRPVINGVTSPLSAREAVNLVRNRPGVVMPAIAAGLMKDQMRERIRNERRVELAFEEHRFFDVRRWKIAEQTESAPLRGMRVVRNSNGTFSYTPFVVENRVFDPKMYLYPIPYQEITKSNGKLTQNPGW
jgi:starch-binding outer membrane protein, SusD/RagB family